MRSLNPHRFLVKSYICEYFSWEAEVKFYHTLTGQRDHFALPWGFNYHLVDQFPPADPLPGSVDARALRRGLGPAGILGINTSALQET